MSRRASLIAKQEKRKPTVRFPDELVFLDNMKDNDIKACHSMLRRASVHMDLNKLDTSGCTPLHNAVLEGNISAVKLLVQHGADVNKIDADTWTPLHAACANGEGDIARFLLGEGASKDAKTADGERPLDLCDPRDFGVISVMLESDKSRRAKLLSVCDEEEDDFSSEIETGDEDNCQDHKSQTSTKDTKDSNGNPSFQPGSQFLKPESQSFKPGSQSISSSSSPDLNRPAKPPGHSILKKPSIKKSGMKNVTE